MKTRVSADGSGAGYRPAVLRPSVATKLTQSPWFLNARPWSSVRLCQPSFMHSGLATGTGGGGGALASSVAATFNSTPCDAKGKVVVAPGAGLGVPVTS